jgi:CubicO group peptidase (beta-lactamase class C family)
VRHATQYSADHAQVALIIQQRGRVPHRAGSSSPYHVRSITKNFWGVLTLIAVDDGILRLDEPASATLTEWQGDPRKSRITVRQLLNQTAGLAPGSHAIYGSRSTDKYAAALAQPAIAEPGSTFRYGPAHMEALGELLRRKLEPRGLTPHQYINARLLRPLGITSAQFHLDAKGNPSFSAGLRIAPQDLLRFARFLENRGRTGPRRLISPTLLNDALTGSDANAAYGLTFWLNQAASDLSAHPVEIEPRLETGSGNYAWRGPIAISTHAPPDLVMLLGSRNQRVFIVPSQDLVIVRLGSGTSFRDQIFLDRLFSGK